MFPAVQGITIDDERISTQVCDRAELPSRKDGMRGAEENMLKLAYPRFVAIVEDFDAPDLVIC